MYSKGSDERFCQIKGSTTLIDYRSEYRKDYAKLVHSACFRRLQGKTQLFPGIESDFFRNRMTHSFEVAQIAKGIALYLNSSVAELKGREIDYDIVEFAGLAHDLGHPPFGHNGEAELNLIMKDNYGYEGNAQTLRILTTLEKKCRSADSLKVIQEDKSDIRRGLNLTFRSLASILKYDREIPKTSDGVKINKGYYYYDSELVKIIKTNVAGSLDLKGAFKTVECQIMDIADDIAYSTYDLEDSLKAGFIHLLEFFTPDKKFFKLIAQKVAERTGLEISADRAFSIFLSTIYSATGGFQVQERQESNISNPVIVQAGSLFDTLRKIGDNGYLRTNLTSNLVHRFINGVTIEVNQDIPALSKVELTRNTLEEVEVLKNLVFVSQIESPRLKISEYRGREIVRLIFEALNEHNGSKLMPDDFKEIYNAVSAEEKPRVIVDFIAGMTDRYAIEFYSRLKSENPQTIFKPL